MDIMGPILIGVLVLVGIAICIFLICFCFCNISTKQSPKIKQNLDIESQRLNQNPDIHRTEEKEEESDKKKITSLHINMPPEKFVVVGDIAALEAYEDLRKQAKIELGYTTLQGSPDTPRKLKIQQVCWCKSFHILYRKNHQETWECAHINNESDWQNLKFEKICEHCQVMDKFGLHNDKFHRLFLDDGMNVYATTDLFMEDLTQFGVKLKDITFS